MADRIFVGRGYARFSVILPLAIGIPVFAIGVAISLADPDFASIAPTLRIMGAAVSLPGVLAILWVRKMRRWIEIGPDGFLVEDGRGRREFRDSDVEEIRLAQKTVQSEGLPSAVQRNATLRIQGEGGFESIEILHSHSLKVVKPDSLGAWIDRVAADLAARLDTRLRAGQSIPGEGIELTPSGVVLGSNPPHSLRYDELAAAGLFDDKVAIWEKGKDDPVARIPIESTNARALLTILEARIPESDAARHGVESAGLGRVLFERRSTGLAWGLWTIGGAVFAIALVLAFAPISGIGSEKYLVALPFAAAGLASIAGGWYARTNIFRCHQRGICRETVRGPMTLRYEDVASLKYRATRQFVNGSYTGTDFNIEFLPLPGVEGSRRIHYHASLKGMDDELENLRAHVSQVIAARLAGEFAAKRPVDWTPNLRLLPEGIEYRPAGFFGRKPPVLIPYSEISGRAMEGGVFYIWRSGEKKAFVREKVSELNFFPGRILFESLFSDKSTESPESGADDDLSGRSEKRSSSDAADF